jgi:hypothetical protein
MLDTNAHNQLVTTTDTRTVPMLNPRISSEAIAESAWLIYFHDADIRPEVFTGEGAEAAARRRFADLRQSWTVDLFQQLAQQPAGDRDVMQATADRVDKWPAWKQGEESARQKSSHVDCQECLRLRHKCPKCYEDSCLCGGVGCNRCEPRGVY